MLQRAFRGLLELDCCRVDGFEVFAALAVDLAEAVIEREAFLGQGYLEQRIFATPPCKFLFTIFWQSVFVIWICILVVLLGLESLVEFCEFFLEALVLGGEFAVHDLACVKGVVPFFDFAFELPGVMLVFFNRLHIVCTCPL